MTGLIGRGGLSNAAVGAYLARSKLGVADDAVDAHAAARMSGPLLTGEVQEAGELVVEQVDEHTTEVTYYGSFARIVGAPGEHYSFSVEPAIAGPPPSRVAESLALSLPALDNVTPEPGQRVLRLRATAGVSVELDADGSERVASLVVHRSRSEATDAPSGEAVESDVWDSGDDAGAQIVLDTTTIWILSPEGQPRPRFAYWIDPQWTGESGQDKRVTIAAAPGVTVDTHDIPALGRADYGRRLVPDVVRVPHSSLVPSQGERFSADDFVGTQVLSGEAPDADEQFVATTGLAGVTIEHPSSGAHLSLRPRDRQQGAAYAWQILPPTGRDGGRIRAVVGPGVEVELAEPVPERLRTETIAGVPEPLPGEAQAGEGLESEGVDLELVEVPDPEAVPPQGTPLNLEYLCQQRWGDRREPDVHRWLGANELATGLGTTAVDVGVGLVPVVGDLADIGEFAGALLTDRDRWGRDVSSSDKVLMGIGAVLGLLPGLGGVGSVLRGAANSIAGALRWGKTAEQLDVILVAVRNSTVPDDHALLRRALDRADLDPADLSRLDAILANVGSAAPLIRFGLRDAAAQAVPLTDVAALGRGALARADYLDALVAARKSGGDVPRPLLAPLAEPAAFTSAEDAEAALRQALRDRARQSDADFDFDLAEDVADDAADALTEIFHVDPQTRRVAVSDPGAQLLAQYERAANQKLRAIVLDVLEAQRQTPVRARLEVLRDEFDALRSAVPEGAALTAEQRARAMTLLDEARDKARADFDNVRNSINKRLSKDKELRELEQQLIEAGDAQRGKGGGLQIRTSDDAGDVRFEPLNIEHRTRLSDNPWGYNHYENLLVTDAAQNQQYLETLRKLGGIWPTDDTERFIISHALHNQKGVEFRPGTR